jgi:hypothetical protein
MATSWHFPIFVVVSFVAFAAVLHRLLRDRFTAKPGQAGKLLAHMKEVASAGELKRSRR